LQFNEKGRKEPRRLAAAVEQTHRESHYVGDYVTGLFNLHSRVATVSQLYKRPESPSPLGTKEAQSKTSHNFSNPLAQTLEFKR
jgi:hypothetical protein